MKRGTAHATWAFRDAQRGAQELEIARAKDCALAAKFPRADDEGRQDIESAADAEMTLASDAGNSLRGSRCIIDRAALVMQECQEEAER